tara:strand:+ start:305 stop:1036 length:732 start_codon:yes stop_codon:yes gene_type:complete
MIYPLGKLKEKVNKKEAVFLGSGPSINNITKEQQEKLKQYDLWSSNSWIAHKTIIPDFYHLEVKAHRNGKFAERMLKEKAEQYKDVNWILDNTRPYLLNYVKPELYENIYVYNKQHRNSNSGKYKVTEQIVGVSCSASLTCILDVMIKMGYEKIYLIGVDLKSGEYFWTDNPEYDDVGIPDIIQSCKPDERSKNDIHSTAERGIHNFIAELGETNNVEMINLSDTSLLKNTIKSMTLQEFCNV